MPRYNPPVTPPLTDAPGTYALILRCTLTRRIRIGALGILPLQPGVYIYIGSAFGSGGLRARVSRHQRRTKPLRWHIDYLRRHTRFETALLRPHEACEHEWAAHFSSLPEARIPLPGFGSSDCHCPAHLIYIPNWPLTTGH